MTSELVTCPFCGSDEIGHRSDNKSYLGQVCATCGAQGPMIDGDPRLEATWDKSYDAWNKRVGTTNEAWYPITDAVRDKRPRLLCTPGTEPWIGFWSDWNGYWTTGQNDRMFDHIRHNPQPTLWTELPPLTKESGDVN